MRSLKIVFWGSSAWLVAPLVVFFFALLQDIQSALAVLLLPYFVLAFAFRGWRLLSIVLGGLSCLVFLWLCQGRGLGVWHVFSLWFANMAVLWPLGATAPNPTNKRFAVSAFFLTTLLWGDCLLAKIGGGHLMNSPTGENILLLQILNTIVSGLFFWANGLLGTSSLMEPSQEFEETGTESL